ncbi:dienelactone hydrolase family protein [Alteromonadaceae bacterium BrNp21-10]|nr:dienelactone hydrolase family protein [Alteromonadaceae bacterium BrNp21-10]
MLFVTDIFGNNGHLNPYISLCKSQGRQVQILDPYAGAKFDFADDQQAYEYFTQHAGHDYYLDLVQHHFSKLTQPTTVIGFSAGASAVWRAISQPTSMVDKFIGFYPGQIRHYLDLAPQCATHLYFPQQEFHFDVEAVIASLLAKKTVDCVHSEYQHGFVNTASAHYSAEGSTLLLKLLASN